MLRNENENSGNYECQCGFKSSDLEELLDHNKFHKNSICECGCGFETGSTEFQRLHVDFEELEKQQIYQDEHEKYISSQARENTQGLIRKDLLLEVI